MRSNSRTKSWKSKKNRASMVPNSASKYTPRTPANQSTVFLARGIKYPIRDRGFKFNGITLGFGRLADKYSKLIATDLLWLPWTRVTVATPRVIPRVTMVTVTTPRVIL